MHKSLDEFEIRPDATTGFHGNRYVSVCVCVWGGKRTFSIRFISYLQVKMIYIRA